MPNWNALLGGLAGAGRGAQLLGQRQQQRRGLLDDDFSKDFQLRQAGYQPLAQGMAPSPDALSVPTSQGARSYAFNYEQSPAGIAQRRVTEQSAAKAAHDAAAQRAGNLRLRNVFKALAPDDPMAALGDDDAAGVDYGQLVQERRAALDDARRNPPPPRQKRTQYDAERGVMIDLDTGEAVPVKGLPAKPVTQAQSDATTQRSFQRTDKMRDDYAANPAVKKGYELSSVAGGIRAALSQKTPVSDLSAIYELVKMFDPASVVREGEIRLAAKANSLPSRIGLLVSNWNKGRLVTDQMRADMEALLGEKIGNMQGAIRPVQANYGAQARRAGVSRDSAYIAPSPFDGMTPSRPSAGNADPEAAWAAANPPKPGESLVMYHARYLQSRRGR